jgi:hypothetical protein
MGAWWVFFGQNSGFWLNFENFGERGGKNLG